MADAGLSDEPLPGAPHPIGDDRIGRCKKYQEKHADDDGDAPRAEEPCQGAASLLDLFPANSLVHVVGSRPEYRIKLRRGFTCRKSKTDCARYMICERMGQQSVPADLFPNDRARAFDVLGKAGHVM